jgi:hypothetical protein
MYMCYKLALLMILPFIMLYKGAHNKLYCTVRVTPNWQQGIAVYTSACTFIATLRYSGCVHTAAAQCSTQLLLLTRLHKFIICCCLTLLQVLSLHVDEVTIAKPSGSVKTQLAVYHLQVDDMRSKTSMPVVLQPTDSGTCQAPLCAQNRAIRVLSQCCIIYMLQCMTTSSGSSQHCECASCALTRACTSLRKHAMQLQSTQPDHSNL